MPELSVTVATDTQVVQMVCGACNSRFAILLSPEAPMRRLRFCAVCGGHAVFFNAEDRQW